MINIQNAFISLLWSPKLLFAIIIISSIVKFYFLTIITQRATLTKNIFHPLTFAVVILIASLFGDIAWIIKIVQYEWVQTLSYATVTFFIRLSWAFVVIQYQAIGLFMQSLLEKRFRLNFMSTILFPISTFFSCYFFYLAFFETSLTTEHDREMAKLLVANVPLEIQMMRYTVIYLLNILMIPGFYTTIEKIRTKHLPKMLRKQLVIFMRYLLCPYIMTELVQTAHFLYTPLRQFRIPLVNISTLFLIYATYYCMNKILSLRFSTTQSLLSPSTSIVTVNQMKACIDNLTNASCTEELGHIVQSFFSNTYNIPIRYTSLHMRPIETQPVNHWQTPLEEIVDQRLHRFEQKTLTLLETTKILSYDDISFDQFYEPNSEYEPVLELLDSINADILVPIYLKRKIIAYVVIKRNARGAQAYYSDSELHEILLFCSYLGNIISTLQNHSFEKMAQHTKSLRDMLHNKNQEIGLFKESIRSCVNHKAHTAPGIIRYHNRRFIFENQRAHQLLSIDPNEQIGHPLTHMLKQLTHDVYRYKTAQTALFAIDDSKKLLINATTHIESNDILFSIEYPDVTDILISSPHKMESSLLWEHILYLETTTAGKLLHDLIPSNSQRILDLKIELLRASIANKPLCIEISKEDTIDVVTTIHQVSKRTRLHSLSLTSKEQGEEISLRLFGTNHGIDTYHMQNPLIETGHSNGTLHIHNPQFLSISTQAKLAHFLRTGYYSPHRSDTQLASDIRLICTADYPITSLAESHAITPELFAQLSYHILSFPSLKEFSSDEVVGLIDGIWAQLIREKPYHQLLNLQDHEKSKIVKKEYQDLHTLKFKLHHILSEKIRNIASHESTEPSVDTIEHSEHEIIGKIAERGKHALKDPELMKMLWNTFKSQNKIALLLKVNRSSVNRRCKEYNLI